MGTMERTLAVEYGIKETPLAHHRAGPMSVAHARVQRTNELCRSSFHPNSASICPFVWPAETCSIRAFETSITLPPEHLLSREVKQYSALRFSVSARLLMRSDGRFQLSAGECAQMKQTADKAYEDAVIIEGSFREVENGRITFWCSEDCTPGGKRNVSFAQFMGVMGPHSITLDYPYNTKDQSCSKGPWGLRGAAYTKVLHERPASEWRRWSH